MLDQAASAVTIVVAVGGLALAGFRQATWLQRFLVLSPVRRSARHTLGPRHRSVARALSTALTRDFRKDDPTPGDLLAEVIAPVQDEPWPDLAPRLERFLREAAPLQRASLLARILYPEDVGRVHRTLDDLASIVGRFAAATPVSSTRWAPVTDDPDGFAAFATAISGAPVMLDTVRTRSGFAHDVLVWHSRAYRSHEAGAPFSSRYDEVHLGGQGCELWDAEARKAGDFDQRVLHVRGVSLAEATTLGNLSVVIETSETCYAATELGERGVGCKRVRPAGRLSPNDPVFTVNDDDGYRLVRTTPDRGRVSHLTAYVSLLTADQKLVLAHRSGHVRNGASVISATAGGVVEPGPPGRSGDVDERGMPDIAGAVRREMLEEIGIELPVDSCRPTAVFLANILGRTEETRQLGQLVTVVLFLARTPLTADEVDARSRTHADLAHGAFETVGLVAAPLECADVVARWAREHATDLDQHGMLSCLYAAVAAFGEQAARDAFAEVFEAPWWAIDPFGGSAPRLVRDPRALLGGCSSPVLASPVAWRSSWESLGLG